MRGYPQLRPQSVCFLQRHLDETLTTRGDAGHIRPPLARTHDVYERSPHPHARPQLADLTRGSRLAAPLPHIPAPGDTDRACRAVVSRRHVRPRKFRRIVPPHVRIRQDSRQMPSLASRRAMTCAPRLHPRRTPPTPRPSRQPNFGGSRRDPTASANIVPIRGCAGRITRRSEFRRIET